jgi:hypothetical protein
VTFRNMFLFLRWGVVSPPPNPQAGVPLAERSLSFLRRTLLHGVSYYQVATYTGSDQMLVSLFRKLQSFIDSLQPEINLNNI